MKETMPAPVVSRLFAEMADGLAKEYASQMKGLDMEERLDLAKTLLTEEGFDIQWEKAGGQYRIHEITCPYLQIGQSHPEVCTVDQTLISKMLAVPAEKVQCVLQGDVQCTYVVQAEAMPK
jgi:DeoR family suf operon transcriptional repressor